MREHSWECVDVFRGFNVVKSIKFHSWNIRLTGWKVFLLYLYLLHTHAIAGLLSIERVTSGASIWCIKTLTRYRDCFALEIFGGKFPRDCQRGIVSGGCLQGSIKIWKECQAEKLIITKQFGINEVINKEFWSFVESKIIQILHIVIQACFMKEQVSHQFRKIYACHWYCLHCVKLIEDLRQSYTKLPVFIQVISTKSLFTYHSSNSLTKASLSPNPNALCFHSQSSDVVKTLQCQEFWG